MGAMHVLACADKFRGTLTAPEFGAAVVAGAEGHEVVVQPLADGGEGTLDAFGGPNRRTTVTGPLGDPVDAAWRLSGGRAVIEMARASGLSLVGGADGNDPLEATTAGTGELIAKAVEAGAREIIVGLGGSATTDGVLAHSGPYLHRRGCGGGSGRGLRRRDAPRTQLRCSGRRRERLRPRFVCSPLGSNAWSMCTGPSMEPMLRMS